MKIGGFLNKPTFDIGLNEMKDKIVEEVKEVYNNTPENSQARTVAEQKLRELQ